VDINRQIHIKKITKYKETKQQDHLVTEGRSVLIVGFMEMKNVNEAKPRRRGGVLVEKCLHVHVRDSYGDSYRPNVFSSRPEIVAVLL